jgi:TatD DNase family protein
MSLLIDIHTHGTGVYEGITRVRNFFPADIPLVDASPHERYSCGIHPWFILETDIQKSFEDILGMKDDQRFVALGEAGLDRLAKTSLVEQVKVLEAHIELSERLNKPLIIHCVKAFPELIQLRKSIHPSSDWIVHGFRHNERLANDLVSAGFYLSFGPALLNSTNPVREYMGSLPLDRLFFETDDTGKNIEHLYLEASTILEIPMDQLTSRIHENFINCTRNDTIL